MVFLEQLEALIQYATERDIEVVGQSVAGEPAMSIKYQDQAYAIVDFVKIERRPEQTVALCHELGHIETNSMRSLNEPFVPPGVNEYRAWKWTIKRLLPREKLQYTIAACDGRLWDVAEELDVTPALVERAIHYYQTKC